MELTIQRSLGYWVVTGKSADPNVFITCVTADEAMEILQQLNGKKFEELEAFIKLRSKLNA